MQRLPYVTATMMEIQRVSATAPGSVPHVLTTDKVTVKGYHFPKGTHFISNLVKIMMDPGNTFWKDK